MYDIHFFQENYLIWLGMYYTQVIIMFTHYCYIEGSRRDIHRQLWYCVDYSSVNSFSVIIYKKKKKKKKKNTTQFVHNNCYLNLS